jgi:LysM repeat protein
MKQRNKVILVTTAVTSLILLASFSSFLASQSYSFTYSVKPGDTLGHIGTKYNVSWQSIASANGIASPYVLYVGEQLNIPLQSPSITYTVQPGDYLSAIGNYFEVPWQSIASANGIASPYNLYVGETLVIPLDTPVQSTSSTNTEPTSSTTLQLAAPRQTSTVYVNSTAYVTSTLTTYLTSIQRLTSTVTATRIATSTTISSSTITTTSWVWSTVTSVLTTLTTTTSTVFQSDVSTSTAIVQSTATVTSTQATYTTLTTYTTMTAVVTQTSTSTSTAPSSTSSTSNADRIATGNSLYDSYDSVILAAASQYSLDPMVLKSQMAQESFFNPQAVSPDDPCGQIIQNGIDVGHSYGLMQMTPACISWFAKNPDGSVDLSTNATSSQWANSAFNPVYNVNSAANAWAAQLQQEEQSFPGCTQTQYVKMTLEDYNAGPNSVTSCTSYNAQGTAYIKAILNWYSQFAAMAGIPDPY